MSDSWRISLIQLMFILITGDNDGVYFENIFPSIGEFEKFANSEKIIHWYAQDLGLNHPKVSHIPLGLDYHTLTERTHFWGPMAPPLVQEQDLFSVKASTKPFWERMVKAYSNFHLNNLDVARYNDRRKAIAEIPKDCVFYEPHPVPRLESWKRQSEYAFVICPHGGGLDCHRNWEALNLGCIIVVKRSTLDPLYNDFPVLILREWSDLSLDLMESVVKAFKTQQFNYDKLTSKYWLDKVGLKL